MVGTLDVLTDPASFFEREVDAPRVVAPSLIVIAVGLVSTLSIGATVATLLGSLEGGAVLVAVAVVVGLVVSVSVNLIFWVLFAGAFYVVSRLVGDGEGAFRELFLLTGWGFLPRIFGAAVGVLGTVVSLQGVTPPDVSLEQDPTVVQAELQRFAAETTSGPVELVTGVAGIGFLLWSAYIWVAAVETSRGLDRRDALVAVGIPVLLVLLFRLNALV